MIPERKEGNSGNCYPLSPYPKNPRFSTLKWPGYSLRVRVTLTIAKL
jgi:hypothetical protein